MLCCPRRVPLSASNRLPGGTRKSPSAPAESSCSRRLRAIFHSWTGRSPLTAFDDFPLKRSSVAASWKVWITVAVYPGFHAISPKRANERDRRGFSRPSSPTVHWRFEKSPRARTLGRQEPRRRPSSSIRGCDPSTGCSDATSVAHAEGPSRRPSGRPTTGCAASKEDFDRVIALSLEGMSKAGIARVTGKSWNTVARWLERAATHAHRFQEAHVRSVEAVEMQLDELRTCLHVRAERPEERRTPAMQAGLMNRRLTLRDVLLSSRPARGLAEPKLGVWLAGVGPQSSRTVRRKQPFVEDAIEAKAVPAAVRSESPAPRRVREQVDFGMKPNVPATAREPHSRRCEPRATLVDATGARVGSWADRQPGGPVNHLAPPVASCGGEWLPEADGSPNSCSMEPSAGNRTHLRTLRSIGSARDHRIPVFTFASTRLRIVPQRWLQTPSRENLRSRADSETVSGLVPWHSTAFSRRTRWKRSRDCSRPPSRRSSAC